MISRREIQDTCDRTLHRMSKTPEASKEFVAAAREVLGMIRYRQLDEEIGSNMDATSYGDLADARFDIQVQLFRNLFNLTKPELATLLNLPYTIVENWEYSDKAHLNEARSKIHDIVTICQSLVDLVTPETIPVWARSKNLFLGGKSPEEFIKTEPAGIQRLAMMLGQIGG